MASYLQMCLLTVNDQLDLFREQQPLLQGYKCTASCYIILALQGN